MADFNKNFKSKNLYLSKCFSNKFSNSFELKRSIFICFKGLENSKKKEKSLRIIFDLHFYFILEVFPSIFFMILISKLFIFSHLSHLSILSIRIFILWGKFVCGLVRPSRVVNLLLFDLWVSLLCRGDCRGVWLVSL